MPETRSAEVRLRVSAGSPLAEIFLVDDEFVLVARAVGDLDRLAAPGVYKVKARLGDATVERLVLLETDQSLDLAADLDLGSPVPGSGGPERDQGSSPLDRPAATPNRRRTRLGDDRAELFLQLRVEPTSDEPPPQRVQPPAVTLLRLDGSVVEALEPESDGGSVTVPVDPGPYLVRHRDRAGDVTEQCVHAVAGWQTQVFTLETAADPTYLGGTRVSVLMARQAFDPGAPGLRLVEEARIALAGKRKVATEAVGALVEATDDPMLALFGAHLMLVGRDAASSEPQRTDGRPSASAVPAPLQFDQGRFDRVVVRLTGMLGADHPDVVALATQRSDVARSGPPAIAAPPMLWRSWVLLVAASSEAPDLVPVGTWRRTLHAVPLRPFFCWTPTTEQNAVTRRWLSSLARGPAAPPRRAPSFGLAPGPVGPEEGAADPAAVDPEAERERRRVSETLLVPRAVLDRLAAGEEL